MCSALVFFFFFFFCIRAVLHVICVTPALQADAYMDTSVNTEGLQVRFSSITPSRLVYAHALTIFLLSEYVLLFLIEECMKQLKYNSFAHSLTSVKNAGTLFFIAATISNCPRITSCSFSLEIFLSHYGTVQVCAAFAWLKVHEGFRRSFALCHVRILYRFFNLKVSTL